MWTPRRIGLLLLGFVLFFLTYGGYTWLLGWLDGLPQLPGNKLPKADDTPKPVTPPAPRISPTEQRIIEAWGPNCVERSKGYLTKLEFRDGESSVVLAAGPFPLEPGSSKVALVPFSMAVFGKPKPIHLRQVGEAVEISTFHADKAVLEYDRPINTPQDMSRAKLIRMELVSEPVSNPEELAVEPRRGKVHITNNQRSADPNQTLVLRSPGPVFYRDKKLDAKPDNGPDIWTEAAIEVVDRGNLPHPFGAASPPTAPARGADLRDGGVVADILSGQRLPPPTVAAVGMRLFLESTKPAKEIKPAESSKKPVGGMSGLRRLELSEKVLINLWVDSRASFMGDPAPANAKEPAKGPNPLDAPQPPMAAGGVLGGMLDGVQAAHQLDRALLQIETLGPFAYETATSTARFDVLAQANPDVPNDVQVTRVMTREEVVKGEPPRERQNKLFSQTLEIEFNGSPTSGGAPATAAATGGPTFKKLHAWTNTPGRFLTVSADSEQLEAFGQDLVFDQVANTTVLQGAPLYTIKERNVLTAGSKNRPAQLIMAPGPGPDKRSTATVHGPGRLELYDAAADANTLHATWETSLTNTKDRIDNREVDLLTFTDGAAFEDKKADFFLKGNVLKLWLDGESGGPKTKGETGGQPRPQRIQAVGDVTAHSTDTDVDGADQLNVFFADAPPPTAEEAKPSAPPTPESGGGSPSNPAPAVAPTPDAPPAKTPSTAPAKPKPPMKLKSRLIDLFVARIPVPGAKTEPAVKTKGSPKADGKAAEGNAIRYELKTARCEDRVVVHQDPSEPDKPRGVDILGQTLDLKHSPLGSEMTVTGTDDKPAQVHYESTSIVGPKVFIDQLHNRASVEGRGMLQMPTNSDLNGTELKQPQDVTVHWRDGMTFAGALKKAEFLGKVSALQGESWVTCHFMAVGFDRPVYFNQLKKPDDAPTSGKDGKDGPKIQSVRCYPAPGDALDDPREKEVTYNEVVRDEKSGAVIKTQRVLARELRLDAQEKNREQHNNVIAEGPGETRLWQQGQKDWAAPANDPNGAKPLPPPAKDNPDADAEMKLTIVKYGSRMAVQDKKIFTKAIFSDNIQLLHIPTDNPNAQVELHQLPPGSVFLTCVETLTATTHRKADGTATQAMEAKGNAYIRTDEYEGWGETIDYDGKWVILNGSKSAPARITSRFKGSQNTGRVIKLDRLTNRYELVDGLSGMIETQGK